MGRGKDACLVFLGAQWKKDRKSNLWRQGCTQHMEKEREFIILWVPVPLSSFFFFSTFAEHCHSLLGYIDHRGRYSVNRHAVSLVVDIWFILIQRDTSSFLFVEEMWICRTIQQWKNKIDHLQMAWTFLRKYFCPLSCSTWTRVQEQEIWVPVQLCVLFFISQWQREEENDDRTGDRECLCSGIDLWPDPGPHLFFFYFLTLFSR